MITFDLEVSLIWNSNWSLVKVVYLVNRFLPVLEFVFAYIRRLSFHTLQRCFFWPTYRQAIMGFFQSGPANRCMEYQVVSKFLLLMDTRTLWRWKLIDIYLVGTYVAECEPSKQKFFRSYPKAAADTFALRTDAVWKMNKKMIIVLTPFYLGSFAYSAYNWAGLVAPLQCVFISTHLLCLVTLQSFLRRSARGLRCIAIKGYSDIYQLYLIGRLWCRHVSYPTHFFISS